MCIFKSPLTTIVAIDRVVHHAVILDLIPVASFRAPEPERRLRHREDERIALHPSSPSRAIAPPPGPVACAGYRTPTPAAARPACPYRLRGMVRGSAPRVALYAERHSAMVGRRGPLASASLALARGA